MSFRCGVSTRSGACPGTCRENCPGTGGQNRAAGTRAQRGAVAVEAAIIVPLVVSMLLGIIDLAMMLHSQVGLASAARSGARVASSEPRTPGFADHAASAALRSGLGVAWSEVEEIWVYRANASGYPGTATGFPADCPQRCIRYRVSAAGVPVVLQGSWAADSVDACVGTADDVGVRIVGRHRSVAASVVPSGHISQYTVMRFEPTVNGRCRP